jgi:hypothetical protein
MNTQLLSLRYEKFLGFILVLLSVHPGPTTLPARGVTQKQLSDNQVRGRISLLIRQTIQQSKTKLTDGSYATVMPVLPSNDALQEVRRYKEQAVRVLAHYLSSTQALEQHISLRFLFEFHDDSALAAVRAFAEKSTFAGIRQEAVAGLTGFPSEKVKPIVEQISTSDPDPDVRAYARRILASFLSAKEQ